MACESPGPARGCELRTSSVWLEPENSLLGGSLATVEVTRDFRGFSFNSAAWEGREGNGSPLVFCDAIRDNSIERGY
jgi:hypothetical protein